MVIPNDWAGDRIYWQLTPAQYARYLTRLSRYHADQATRWGHRAEQLGRRARFAAIIGVVSALGALALNLIAR